MDYPTSCAPAPRAAAYRPGYTGGFVARPQAGQQPRLPEPGRHAAKNRGAPRRVPPDLAPPTTIAVAPGFSQRMRAAARNHTGAAALTAAAVVGTGVGVGMFGFAPFASPGATPASVNAAMPAAPPVVSVAGSATPVHHHTGHPNTGYLGRHRKAEPRPTAHATHQLAGAASAGYGTGTQPASPAPQSTGSGGSAPAGSSAPAPQPSPSSTPRSSSGGSGGQTGTGTGTGTGSGGGSGSGHSGGGQGSGGGGLLGGLGGLLGGLGL